MPAFIPLPKPSCTLSLAVGHLALHGRESGLLPEDSVSAEEPKALLPKLPVLFMLQAQCRAFPPQEAW